VRQRRALPPDPQARSREAAVGRVVLQLQLDAFRDY
jgi:hypothetical protein